jgi:hypothetical protein
MMDIVMLRKQDTSITISLCASICTKFFAIRLFDVGNDGIPMTSCSSYYCSRPENMNPWSAKPIKAISELYLDRDESGWGRRILGL